MTHSQPKRVVVTGMAVFTPMGETLEQFWDNLIAGKSGITNWKTVDSSKIYSKVGGDLDPDYKAILASLKDRLPDAKHAHLRKIFKSAPFSAKVGLISALNAWKHAGFEVGGAATSSPFETSVIVGGHNFNQRYTAQNHDNFLQDPEYVDGLYALVGLDTYIPAAIADMLGSRGPVYTIGGACASTNLALRDALNEIRYHDGKVSVVAGAPFDFGVLDLQSMCFIDAITFKSYNDRPAAACRPYDANREGFVPTYGAGTLVVEELDHALARGATIYAEVLGVQANWDANHLPQPSAVGQAALIRDLLRRCGLKPSDIDYINAHATSTPMGDLEELKAIQDVFGDHVEKLKINATKSMTGHCCWSAPVVESIAGILQMNRNMLHPSINIDTLDPHVKVDVCANRPVEWTINTFLKNSFGFSGINCCAVFRKYRGPGSVVA